jgi:hypothetical protein
MNYIVSKKIKVELFLCYYVSNQRVSMLTTHIIDYQYLFNFLFYIKKIDSSKFIYRYVMKFFKTYEGFVEDILKDKNKFSFVIKDLWNHCNKDNKETLKELKRLLIGKHIKIEEKQGNRYINVNDPTCWHGDENCMWDESKPVKTIKYNDYVEEFEINNFELNMSDRISNYEEPKEEKINIVNTNPENRWWEHGKPAK